jgi:hypothetical protein
MAQALVQAGRIDRSNLIQNDLAALAREMTCHAGWISLQGRRQRRDDRGSDISIQFIGRDDDTWSRLFNFASHGGIQRDKKNIESLRRHLPALPSPFFFVPFTGHIRQKKTVVVLSPHAPKSRVPPRPGLFSRAQYQLIRSKRQFDFTVQGILVDQRLGKANTLGIADGYKLGSHNYNVIIGLFGVNLKFFCPWPTPIKPTRASTAL